MDIVVVNKIMFGWMIFMELVYKINFKVLFSNLIIF